MKPSLLVVGNIDVYAVAVSNQISVYVKGYGWFSKVAPTIPARLVWLILFGLFSSTVIYATTIVAIRTNKNIVLAADSKEYTLATASQPRSVQSVCKIRQSGSVFFTTAGLRRTHNPQTGQVLFNLDDEISAMIASGGTFSQIADRIMSSIPPRLQAVYDQRAGVFPTITVILATTEDGILKLIRCRFEPVERYVIPFGFGMQVAASRADCPESCKDGYMLWVDGEVQALGEFLDQLNSAGTERNIRDVIKRSLADPVAVARELVQMQIDAKGDIVGPPIDILQITKGGAKWIQRKKECPDIKPRLKPPNKKPKN